MRCTAAIAPAKAGCRASPTGVMVGPRRIPEQAKRMSGADCPENQTPEPAPLTPDQTQAASAPGAALHRAFKYRIGQQK